MIAGQQRSRKAVAELIIYTDESEKNGKHFSNFYGGVLVRAPDLVAVIGKLESLKAELNLTGEVKWQKVTENYLEKYRSLLGAFFDLVAADQLKVRVMFTHNRFVPTGLTAEQKAGEYHLLYYQFLKHAFGLPHSNTNRVPLGIRLNLDQLPERREENARFKAFVLGLNHNPQFRAARIQFRRDQISEVRSHDHVLLQCLDVVLGAMAFRLNDKHREKPVGAARRGKRTIAKEHLYRFMLERIRQIYPSFNVGETTGRQGDWANLWNHSYRHWKFVPREHEIDATRAKPKR